MGIESNGMILAASPEGGKPVLVAFDGDVRAGLADSMIRASSDRRYVTATSPTRRSPAISTR